MKMRMVLKHKNKQTKKVRFRAGQETNELGYQKTTWLHKGSLDFTVTQKLNAS